MSRTRIVTVLASAAAMLGLLAQALPAAADTNNPSPWHAHYFTENVEYKMAAPGDTFQFIVQYTNGGRNSWVKGAAGQEARLATGWAFGDTANPRDNMNDFNGGWAQGWISPARITAQVESTVLPGANVTFTYTAKIPPSARGGLHQIKAQPLIEGATWLENYGYYQGFDVLTPNARCTTPASPYACVQGTATAGTCVAAAVPGCTWRADATGFWSTMTVTDGSPAPGQLYAGSSSQWDFFFGTAKKTTTLMGGQIVALNYP